MSVATLPATAAPFRQPDTAGEGRRFLRRFAATLLPLIAGVVAVQIGWQLSGPEHPWPVAVGAAGGWALALAGWLRRLGWQPSALRAVLAAAAAVLAVPATAGWLSPAALVLWGPATTVLAVALTMAAYPLDLG